MKDTLDANQQTQIIQRIKSLVAEVSGYPVSDLKTSTRIMHDLGVQGDDAMDFLEQYWNQFGIEETDIRPGRFFFPESSLLNCILLCKPLYRYLGRKKLPLTIGHLAEVAERHKWFDPSDKCR